MNREEMTQCMRDGCTYQQVHQINNHIDTLQQQNQKYKEVINKAIEYINSYDDGCYTDSTCKYKVAELNITELLDILNEVNK